MVNFTTAIHGQAGPGAADQGGDNIDFGNNLGNDTIPSIDTPAPWMIVNGQTTSPASAAARAWRNSA